MLFSRYVSVFQKSLFIGEPLIEQLTMSRDLHLLFILHHMMFLRTEHDDADTELYS